MGTLGGSENDVLKEASAPGKSSDNKETMKYTLQLEIAGKRHKEVAVRNVDRIPNQGETIITTKDIEGESPTSRWKVTSVTHTISTAGNGIVVIEGVMPGKAAVSTNEVQVISGTPKPEGVW